MSYNIVEANAQPPATEDGYIELDVDIPDNRTLNDEDEWIRSSVACWVDDLKSIIEDSYQDRERYEEDGTPYLWKTHLVNENSLEYCYTCCGLFLPKPDKAGFSQLTEYHQIPTGPSSYDVWLTELLNHHIVCERGYYIGRTITFEGYTVSNAFGEIKGRLYYAKVER
jgi:hypothetical protein